MFSLFCVSQARKKASATEGNFGVDEKQEHDKKAKTCIVNEIGPRCE
jgi:hypothetical protein